MGGMIEVADLSDRYQQLRAEVADLLDIIEAQRTLERGYIGMGKNIMQEKAGRYLSQVRRIRRLLDEP